MRLYVVRHGQTEWNVGLRLQGHSDIALDETGVRQAAAVAAHFGEHANIRVLTSDLSRALETARGISKRLEIDARLRERCFGEFEGQEVAQVKSQVGTAFLTTAPRGGESLQDVWDRLLPITEALNQTEEPIAIVTHGGTASLLLAQLIGGTLQTARAFRLGNATVTELERREDGAWMIVRYNDDAHLAERPVQGDLEGSLAPARS